MGYLYYMRTRDYRGGMAALKEQIERDSVLEPSLYENHLQISLALLEEITKAVNHKPDAATQVAQLERSLRDFYRPTFSRGWAQRFVLNDLRLLEALYQESSSTSSDETPRAAA